MPLAAPMTLLLELGSAAVKVVCPITALAACPLAKFWAKTAAALKRNTQIPFMPNMV
jgi:hypothetical protein